MSSIVNKVKEALHSDKDKQSHPHDSTTTHNTRTNEPRVDAEHDSRTSALNTGTTGTGAYSSNSNYATGPASTTAGPHSSNLANKADPRVDSDLDSRNRVGGTTTSSHATGPATTTAGPHSSNIANKADPRVDSDLDSRNRVGAFNSGPGPATDTAGPHSSNLANKADPRVDSDMDGRTGYNTRSSAAAGTTATTGGLGSHAVHGQQYNTTGTSGLNTSTGHTGTTGLNTTTTGHTGATGLHTTPGSGINTTTGTSGAGYGTGNTMGTTGLTGTHNTHGVSGTHNTHGVSGTHNTHGVSGTHNTHGVSGTHNTHGTTGVAGTTHSTHGTHGTHGTHDTTGLHSTPGPAPTTAGPHKSDMMNKLDPRIDSDLDGSKTVGGNNTVDTTRKDPTDAAQVPPSVLQKHVGAPTIHHDDATHDRERRHSITHRETHSDADKICTILSNQRLHQREASQPEDVCPTVDHSAAASTRQNTQRRNFITEIIYCKPIAEPSNAGQNARLIMSAPISQALWNARIPLHITHPSAPTSPFITSIPRFSYLALLLPRLSAFFNTPCSSFHFENVLLRNLAVGLLVDLYQPSLPWRLVVNDGVSWDISDTFLNAAKEADFIRNGNANQIMKMSKGDTTQLWHAVIDNDYAAYSRINNRLLNAPTALKHVPMRIYLPLAPVGSGAADSGGGEPSAVDHHGGDPSAGAFKIIQSLVQPLNPDRRPRLLGQALREMMPKLFPSSRDPVMANVLLHGVAVPFDAPLAELMREAAYPDGWLSFVVVVL